MKKLIFTVAAALLIIVICLGAVQEKSSYTIDPFDSVTIKLNVKLLDDEQNLSNIRVAYDEDGEALVDDVLVQIDSKNSRKLIITPSSAGWEPEAKYYVVISKDIKTTGSKKLDRDKLIEFSTKPYTYSTISDDTVYNAKLEPRE
jgi:hypothetical protein